MYRFYDMNSFGSECPVNWEEIADALNDIANERMEGMPDADEREIHEMTDDIWEQYWHGETDAPKPAYSTSRQVNTNNGVGPWMDADECAEYLNDPDCPITWETIYNAMDADTWERVRYEWEDDWTERDGLRRYLELAPYDLVIG